MQYEHIFAGPVISTARAWEDKVEKSWASKAINLRKIFIYFLQADSQGAG